MTTSSDAVALASSSGASSQAEAQAPLEVVKAMKEEVCAGKEEIGGPAQYIGFFEEKPNFVPPCFAVSKTLKPDRP